MTLDFKFPDVGEGIQEGTLLHWKVKVGDVVKQDQVLAEVETDKAVVEIPSPLSGKIVGVMHKEGDVVKVGEVMVRIDDGSGSVGGGEVHVPTKEEGVGRVEKGDSEDKKGGGSDHYADSVVGTLDENTMELGEEGAAVESGSHEGRKRMMPKYRKMAREGVGGGARVQKKYDLWGYVERESFVGRRLVASKLQQSLSSSAQYTVCEEADVTDLVKIRKKEKGPAMKQGVKLTFLPFVMKAVVEALQEFPRLNAELNGDEIVVKKYFNFGVAVDTGKKLLVPVVKGVDKKSMLSIAKEIEKLAKKCVDGSVNSMDLKGGSFTITSIGSLGGLFFTPILNSPEVAILGLGRIRELPRVMETVMKVVKPRMVLPLSLTVDHRVVDGAEAVRFLVKVRDLLEDPDRLLVEMG